MNLRSILSRALLVLTLIAPAISVATVAAARPIADGTSPSAVRIVVGVKPGSEKAARAAVEAAGGRLVRRGYKGLQLVAEVPSTGVKRFEQALESAAGVTYADPDRRVHAAFVPNDADYPSQWHLPKIGAPLAWDSTRGDPGTVIAIIDTGVDLDNPDLAANVDTVNDYDFVNRDAVAQDDTYGSPYAFGHGTHVAGLAAAVTNNGYEVAGVAGRSTILPLKALDALGDGAESDVADAIRYAADKGADIINLSLGGVVTGAPDPTMGAAVQYAIDRDVLVVAAAGNEATTQPYYPAAYPGVLGVGATNSTNARASFSNRGFYVDLAAPGEAMWSTQLGGGIRQENGTSMASPIVAGTAALVRSLHPGWSASEVASALVESATDLGTLGRDDSYGYGLVNAADALRVVSPDDQIPGVSLTASPITGRVNANTDPNDVFSIPLTAGRRLRLRLTGDASSSTQVQLLAPGSGTLATASVLAQTTWTSYPKALEYDILSSGTYYIRVTTASGAGGYSLSWAQGHVTSTTITGPSIVAQGAKATLTGTVALSSGLPAVGASVTIEQRPVGGINWTALSARSTDASGAFSLDVFPTSNTEYRAVLPAQADLVDSASVLHAVNVRAYLTRPSTPSSVGRRVVFTTYGYLRPRHTVGARNVKLALYRYQNSGWSYYRSIYATNVYHSAYTTKYKVRFSLPYAGRWKIVASVAADARHVATKSSPRDLTVK